MSAYVSAQPSSSNRQHQLCRLLFVYSESIQRLLRGNALTRWNLKKKKKHFAWFSCVKKGRGEGGRGGGYWNSRRRIVYMHVNNCSTALRFPRWCGRRRIVLRGKHFCARSDGDFRDWLRFVFPVEKESWIERMVNERPELKW